MKKEKLGNLAKNLKKLISNAKISEGELSRRTGVDQSVINRIINSSTSNPTLATLTALSNYFLVSLTDLVGNLPVQSPNGKQSIQHMGWKNVPVLNKEQIKLWLEKGQVADFPLKHIPVDFELTKKIFAFVLEDDVMNPIFNKLEIVIVDPFREVKSGMYVLFQKDNLIVQVGRLKISAVKEFFIQNFNGKEGFEISPAAIFGVIIQSRRTISE